MKYFEVLYKNCFGDKYVTLKGGNSIEEVKINFPTFNGCMLIDCKETSYQNYRSNTIQHFTQYGFSV